MNTSKFSSEDDVPLNTFDKPPKILIVEDERLVSWSLASALRKAGYEIIFVESGERAIEKLYSSHFDLIITDTKLPCIDGYEVATAAKSFSPKVPVIMVSALDEEVARNAALRSNVDCFVEKPFDLKEMTALVGKFVHRYLGHSSR